MAQMEPNGGSKEMKYSIRVTTKMHEIRLTIENVSKVPPNTRLISPDFYLSPECPFNIAFKKNSAELWVFICNKSNTEIKLIGKVIISDCNNRKIYEKSHDEIFSLGKDYEMDLIGRGIGKICNDILTNDTLIIDICLSIKEIVGKRINFLLCQTDPRKKLMDDLKTMLENPNNSDVSLQVGDQRIPAHWSILCSRSPCFKKMFDSQMKERAQNCINITDLSLSTVKKLIHFLYTADSIEEDDLQQLFDLYYAADKYEVMDLRTLCACKIINDVTVDNACQILQFAHRHNDKIFKMEAANFIHAHFNAVFQTDGWKKFEESEPLAAELFEFLCSKKD